MNAEDHGGQFISVNSVTREVVLHCWLTLQQLIYAWKLRSVMCTEWQAMYLKSSCTPN